MAAFAKFLGIMSMVAAVVVGLIALFALGSVQPDWTNEAAGEAILIGVGLGSLSLLLATCGAGAYAAGTAADRPPPPVYFPQPNRDATVRR